MSFEFDFILKVFSRDTFYNFKKFGFISKVSSYTGKFWIYVEEKPSTKEKKNYIT